MQIGNQFNLEIINIIEVQVRKLVAVTLCLQRILILNQKRRLHTFFIVQSGDNMGVTKAYRVIFMVENQGHVSSLFI